MAPCWQAFCVVFALVISSDIVRAAEESRARNEEIGPCLACKIFAESFEKALNRNVYDPARSPERLAEILKNVCEDPRYKTKCLESAGLARPYVEQWWLQDDAPEFYKHICIDKLEVCCPKHHYGRQCLPCQGFPPSLEGLPPSTEGVPPSGVCGGHGKCRGDGTRRGNGTCLCDQGYGGELCTECLTGYYLSLEDSERECKRCHYSCSGGCRNGTPRDCVACRPGFLFDTDAGCQDTNECNDVHICTKDEFCLNSMGSFKCMACDRACKGCYGDSPDMCRKCAKGYVKKGDMCVREREDEETDQLAATRYVTYTGLLVAGGVLYPRAPHLAAGVGALTLSYIALAEYYCRASGHTSLLDLPLFTI